MNADFIKIWEQALEAIKEEISPIGYKTFIEVMVPRLSDENTICFLVPSSYHIEVINKKYIDLITNALIILTNKSYIITFESKEMNESEEEDITPISSEISNNTKDETTKNVENITQPIANQTNSSPIDIGLNPKYTFENYIVGSNNRFAYAAAKNVAENPGEVYNPLYIYMGE
ncbi:MAG: hypothetical protein IKL68_01600 [Clostridia bacterium]|nr:hypothetical protein [Clostridia bacterium]